MPDSWPNQCMTACPVLVLWDSLALPFGFKQQKQWNTHSSPLKFNITLPDNKLQHLSPRHMNTAYNNTNIYLPCTLELWHYVFFFRAECRDIFNERGPRWPYNQYTGATSLPLSFTWSCLIHSQSSCIIGPRELPTTKYQRVVNSLFLPIFLSLVKMNLLQCLLLHINNFFAIFSKHYWCLMINAWLKPTLPSDLFKKSPQEKMVNLVNWVWLCC